MNFPYNAQTPPRNELGHTEIAACEYLTSGWTLFIYFRFLTVTAITLIAQAIVNSAIDAVVPVLGLSGLDVLTSRYTIE